jgi:PAS domain S-box-containing protein
MSLVTEVSPRADSAEPRRDLCQPLESPDFEAFFNVSLDLCVIRDSAFRIVKVNPAWERMLGYRPDELEGQPMLAFIHPEDVALSRGQMVRVEAEKDVRRFINRYRHKDGTYRWLEWRAHQEGELVYGVAREVTQRMAPDPPRDRGASGAEPVGGDVQAVIGDVIELASALSRTELSRRQREMVERILSSSQGLQRAVWAGDPHGAAAEAS